MACSPLSSHAPPTRSFPLQQPQFVDIFTERVPERRAKNTFLKNVTMEAWNFAVVTAIEQLSKHQAIGDDIHFRLRLRNNCSQKLSMSNVSLVFRQDEFFLARILPLACPDVSPVEDIWLEFTLRPKQGHNDLSGLGEIQTGCFHLGAQPLLEFQVRIRLEPFFRQLLFKFSSGNLGIFLWGFKGTGKSSFINSVFSVICGLSAEHRRVTKFVDARPSPVAVTQGLFFF